MPIPCFANQGCTITLDTDVNGALIVDAHIAQSVQLLDGVRESIDGSPPNVGVYLLRYRQQRTDADIGGSSERILSQDLVNPFDCPAFCRIQREFDIRGERRDDIANPSAGEPFDPQYAMGVPALHLDEVWREMWYVRAYGFLELFGGITAANVFGALTNSLPQPRQNRIVDRHGNWVLSNHGYDPGNSLTEDQYGWHQELTVRLAANQAFTLVSGIHIRQKWHYDMITYAVPTEGTSGNQGVLIRGGNALFWPADN